MADQLSPSSKAPKRQPRADSELPTAALRQIATRLQAGENYYEISAALGLTRAECKRRATEVAAALGLPEPLSPRQTFNREVERRTLAGETIRQIAEATGRAYSYVAQVRYQLGFTAYRRLPISEAEEAAIQRLLRTGKSNKAIAREIGCDASTVADRRRPRAGVSACVPSACDCGRPAGHLGLCALAPEKIALLRERLLAGATMTQIAAEFGVSVPHLRQRYGAAMILQLRAEGARCACGKEVGHRHLCAAYDRTAYPFGHPEERRRKRKPPFDLDDRTYRDVYRRYRSGQTGNRIAAEAGVHTTTVRKLIAYWRTHHHNRGRQWLCRCGKPGGHTGGCMRVHRSYVTPRMQRDIEDRLTRGEGIRAIADALDLSIDTVRRHSADARAQLHAQGVTCACGKSVAHAGTCGAKYETSTRKRGRRPLDPDVEARAIAALLRGSPADELAVELGLPHSSLKKLRESFSPEQVAQRRRAATSRRKLRDPVVAERVMTKIRGAVPGGLESALRDDVVSEVWLAVSEGRVDEAKIRGAARTFVGQAIAKWQSRYSRSADASNPEGGRALVDTLADDTAMHHLEDLTIGSSSGA